MSEIRRVADPNEGPADGVSLESNCVHTCFTDKREIESQEILPCKMLTSYEQGTLSISVPSLGIMVSVRNDEVFALMKAGADASIEIQEAKE